MPGTDTWCDLIQITSSLSASISPSIKWGKALTSLVYHIPEILRWTKMLQNPRGALSVSWGFMKIVRVWFEHYFAYEECNLYFGFNRTEMHQMSLN